LGHFLQENYRILNKRINFQVLIMVTYVVKVETRSGCAVRAPKKLMRRRYWPLFW